MKAPGFGAFVPLVDIAGSTYVYFLEPLSGRADRHTNSQRRALVEFLEGGISYHWTEHVTSLSPRRTERGGDWHMARDKCSDAKCRKV